MVKRRPGHQLLPLKNREKTQIVDALKKKCPVAEFLRGLTLSGKKTHDKRF
jgi:hypothetical protein